MRFKTIIQISSEAENKAEALEVVEEYLAGNLVSGVNMKCRTKPVHTARNAACAVVAVLFITAGLLFTIQSRQPQNLFRAIPGTSAVQPPLKTSNADEASLQFKKEWQDRQTREALEYIKR